MGYTREERQQRLNGIVARLRAGERRVTHQRLEIIGALVNRDDHPSAWDLYQELHEHFPTLSLATVYKTLDRLRELGEVVELTFPSGNRYDGMRRDPHAHIVCLQCGTISDVQTTATEVQPHRLSRRYGFHVQKTRVDLYGLCRACGGERSVQVQP